MKNVNICFMRKGFSNNSSSAHSLIFSGKINEDYDTGDQGYFGWENFVLSSVEAKKLYLFSTLFLNYSSNNRMVYPYMIDEKSVRKFIYESFISYVTKNEKLNKIFDREFISTNDVRDIDHQSVLSLPLKYNREYNDRDFFHTDFVYNFFSTIINNDFVILGGNDNDDGHSFQCRDENNYCNIKTIWGLLVGRGHGAFYCVKDGKTGDYVISGPTYKGGITRVSFSDEPAGARQGTEKTEFPYLVDVSITDKCEYNCAFCYMDSKPNGKHARVDYIYKLSEVLKASNVFEVVIGGGEPSLYKDNESKYVNIVHVVGAFKNKGIVVGMTTKNYNIHKEVFFDELMEKLDSLAISCVDIYKIPEVASIFSDTENFNKLSIQYVLESHDLNYLKSFLNKCVEHNIQNITLLGAKSHGRGADVKWHDIDDKWIDIVKEISESHYLRLGIDSVLSNKYREKIIAAGVEHYFLTGEEGKETCFIDAVKGTVSTSSFSREKTEKIDLKKCTSKDFLEAYSKV